jgi:hypothetical protein
MYIKSSIHENKFNPVSIFLPEKSHIRTFDKKIISSRESAKLLKREIKIS